MGLKKDDRINIFESVLSGLLMFFIWTLIFTVIYSSIKFILEIN